MKFLISDFHIGCQLWQASLLKKLGHEVNIMSFSGYKHLNDIDKTMFVEDLISDKSAESIKNIGNLHSGIITSEDADKLRNYDSLIVSFPPRFIEVFKNIEFKNKILLNAGHRLHIYTNNDPWFLDKLIYYIESGKVVLCSMSKYDTEYIKHYLNIEPVELDVACFHLPDNIRYSPIKKEILISPVNATNIKPFTSISEMNLMASNFGYNLIFSYIKTLHANYNYYDIIKYRATVLFPYSAFSISMIELYELNIPMFVPSDELLISNELMNDVSLYPFYCTESYMNALDIPHINSPHKFSPNSYNIKDKKYWLQYSYFKQKKNIIYWNSPEDLFVKLSTLNLQEISERMKLENEIHKLKQLDNWKNIINQL